MDMDGLLVICLHCMLTVQLCTCIMMYSRKICSGIKFDGLAVKVETTKLKYILTYSSHDDEIMFRGPTSNLNSANINNYSWFEPHHQI